MGKKIDSIIEMYNLGLPAPRCIFVMENDSLEAKLNEYFHLYKNEDNLYTIRTDKEDNSMSHKRRLSATRSVMRELSYAWFEEGFQIILQEFIDERKEIKSGNIWLKDNIIIIESANDKHIRFTNGMSLDLNLTSNRFDGFEFEMHKFFLNQNCLSLSEIYRLLRLSRKIPYNNAIIEFSFFNDGRLYFWEIKKQC